MIGRWSKAKRARLVASRVELTERLVSAIRDTENRPAVFINASAVGYYGDTGDEWVDEGSPPGSGFLAELTSRWEETAQVASGLGVRVFLPRIGVVLGVGGGALASMLPVFSKGLGGRLGSGDQWMPWVHLNDVVSAITRALTSSTMSGPANLVAPNPATNRAFSGELAKALGRRAWFPVPAVLLRLALGRASGVVLASNRVRPTRLQGWGFEFTFDRVQDALADVVAEPQVGIAPA